MLWVMALGIPFPLDLVLLLKNIILGIKNPRVWVDNPYKSKGIHQQEARK